jgi:hypothetical protein
MAEPSSNKNLRQVLDWRACGIAGVVASLVFIVCTTAFDALQYKAFFYSFQLIGERLMGADLQAPHEFNAGFWLSGLLAAIVVGVLAATVIAIVIHRFGFWVGLIGGAVLGACWYFIVFYSLANIEPWLLGLKGELSLIAHLIFGATAGAVYEKFERARYTSAGQGA